MDETTRRNRILDAACTAICQHGYHAASMDNVATYSGMSKKTLYHFYPSKRTLFEAVILERLFSRIVFTPDPKDSAEEQLIQLTLKSAEIILHPEKINLLRSVIAASGRNPEITERITQLFEMSKKNFPIQDWLETQVQQGKLIIPNVHDAADQLFGSAIGGTLLAHLCTCKRPRTGKDLENFIRSSVHIFISAHIPSP
ncbi:TetR/AcrR family transcriptional regulator [Neokomagataea anthophila]|uniref:TetR/AcrR family transcriptional regulator n=1 Tax=Neokomagataea anthophila TaxID=2826925 RepID=A0ABS5E4E0_9PROT|nr:TetR/AcrR family transcriptional regulator [Neokomagataea anthophila]MBR0558691.1 TetR/AcrR family transcriptional regulator [Neokomagataea anthophila]